MAAAVTTKRPMVRNFSFIGLFFVVGPIQFHETGIGEVATVPRVVNVYRYDIITHMERSKGCLVTGDDVVGMCPALNVRGRYSIYIDIKVLIVIRNNCWRTESLR